MSKPTKVAPLSMESVHRRVMLALHTIEKEVPRFQQQWLFDLDTGEQLSWIEFVQSAEKGLQSAITTREDLVKALDAYNKDEYEEVRMMPAFKELLRMCDRADAFENYMAGVIRRHIQDACENFLSRYCLSFSAETKDCQGVNLSLDYENKITLWRKQIFDSLEDINAMDDSYKSLADNVKEYIKNYDKIAYWMRESSARILRLVEPTKKWITADYNYPRRIDEEIAGLNKQKVDLKHRLRQVKFKKDLLKANVQRKTFQNAKVERELADNKDEKRYNKKREQTLADEQRNIEGKLERSKEELQEHMTDMKKRSMDISKLNKAYNKIKKLQSDIEVHQRKLDTVNSQLVKLKKESGQLKKSVHLMKFHHEGNLQRNETLRMTLGANEESIKELQENIKLIDSKIVTLKRIRQMKMDPAMLRKIHVQGYHPGQYVEFKDELDEAIKLAALHIRTEWKYLYQRLPFAPPRSYRDRNQDIEFIGLMNTRNFEIPPEELARRSLERWRKLNLGANVGDLVRTLRRIKKSQIGNLIEKEVAKVSKAVLAVQVDSPRPAGITYNPELTIIR